MIVWHDEEITPEKCIDTAPVVKDDPDFPYVGKPIAKLTLAQIKTLDCGSLRLPNYPLQLTYPRTKISTLREVFEFVDCVDPMHQILWNIESKVNPVHPNKTRGVKDFVEKQHKEFISSPYPLSQITYQSFDWRTLIAMKALEPRIAISALIDVSTATTADNSTSPWLAGLRLDEFSGLSLGVRIANAASFIGAQILSPAAVDYTGPEYALFTTKEMVRRAHQVGMSVKPWTVNSMSIAEDLMDSEAVDGIISDYPSNMRRFIKQRGLSVAPKFPKKRVYECLDQHVQRDRKSVV